jgi:hypothetical protein
LFVLTSQLSSLSCFKVNFELGHINIGDKEGNLDILSFEKNKNI